MGASQSQGKINHILKRLDEFVKKKRNMDEQLELSSQHQRSVGHVPELVQHSIIQKNGMEI